MLKETPFISTTPLDIVAFGMSALFLLTMCLSLFLFVSVLTSAYDIDINFDMRGYDLLVTRQTTAKTGYGFTFKKGFKLWKYTEFYNGEKKETLIFPFNYS